MALDKPKETNSPTPPVEETPPITPDENTVPPVDENTPSASGETGILSSIPPVDTTMDTETKGDLAVTNGENLLITPDEIGNIKVIANPWSDPTEHPEDNVVVLCEIFPSKPLADREYVKGQFDSHTGNFFTVKDGPYKIIDVSRWQHIKE